MPDALDFGPFAALTPPTRALLEASAVPVDIPAGGALVREGEDSDDAYALLRGRVRVLSADGKRAVSVIAAPGLVGELSALRGEPRSATVVAAQPVRALRLPAAALREAAAREPAFEAELRAFGEARHAQALLQRDSPFADLPSDAVGELAARMRVVRFADGEVLVREGDHDDDVYLLRGGTAEVVRGDRALTTLGPGSVIGEIAALSGGVRTATVRARGPVEAFRAAGADVRAVVGGHRATVDRLESAMRTRHAPRPTTTARIEPAPDDPTSVIAHDDITGAYLRLGRDALAIYEDLDGDRTLRDLALRHFARTGALDPQGVFETVAKLQAAGLATAPRVADDAPQARLMRLADTVLAPRYEVRDADRAAAALHRLFGGAFTPGGVAVAIALGTVGLAIFARLFRLADPGSFGLGGLAVAFVGLLVAGLGHEAAHAIATKAFGRRVGRAGIGLLWFTPVIYVDTSDAWLLDRRRRALVSVAGPLFNYAAAGVCAIAAAFSGGLAQDLFLWLAGINLVSVVFNLSPLLEFDGYYALSDLVDVNALRRKALRFVFRELVMHPRAPRTRLERGLLAYTAAAIGYVLVVTAVVLLGVPSVVEGLLGPRFDAAVRAAAGVAIATVLAATLVGPFLGEVLAARAGDAVSD